MRFLRSVLKGRPALLPRGLHRAAQTTGRGDDAKLTSGVSPARARRERPRGTALRSASAGSQSRHLLNRFTDTRKMENERRKNDFQLSGESRRTDREGGRGLPF